jgi:hypothetical protein
MHRQGAGPGRVHRQGTGSAGAAAAAGSRPARTGLEMRTTPEAQTPPPVCARREPALRPSVRKRRGAAQCGRLPRPPALPQRQLRRPPTPTAVVGASRRTRSHPLKARRNLALIVGGGSRLGQGQGSGRCRRLATLGVVLTRALSGHRAVACYERANDVFNPMARPSRWLFCDWSRRRLGEIQPTGRCVATSQSLRSAAGSRCPAGPQATGMGRPACDPEHGLRRRMDRHARIGARWS